MTATSTQNSATASHLYDLSRQGFAAMMKSDLKAKNEHGSTLIMAILMGGIKDIPDFTPAKYMELARKSDLKAREKNGYSTIEIFMISSPHDKGFTPEQVLELLVGCQVTRTVFSRTVETLCLSHERLPWTAGQVMPFLRAADTNAETNEMATLFINMLAARKTVEFSREQILEIAGKSDLTIKDGWGRNVLFYLTGNYPEFIPDFIKPEYLELWQQKDSVRGKTALEYAGPKAVALYEAAVLARKHGNNLALKSPRKTQKI